MEVNTRGGQWGSTNHAGQWGSTSSRSSVPYKSGAFQERSLCIMNGSSSAYSPSNVTRAKRFLRVVAKQQQARCPPTCQLCGPNPRTYYSYNELVKAHKKKGYKVPSADATELWECTINQQTLGLSASEPVVMLRFEAMKFW